MGRHTKQRVDKAILVPRLARMRIEGSSTLTTVRFMMEELGLNRNVAYEVMKDVHQYIGQIALEDSKEAFSNTIHRLEELYERGSEKTKVEVLKEISKLYGLYATQKVDITSGGQSIAEIKLIKVENPKNE
jgi:hypothetical protein